MFPNLCEDDGGSITGSVWSVRTLDEDKHNSLRGMPEIYVQTNMLLACKTKVVVLRSVQERKCEHPVEFLHSHKIAKNDY